MRAEFRTLASGTVTSPFGFVAGAVQSGIRSPNKLDLAILYSEVPCTAAGMFTTNAIKAAPVVLTQKHLRNKRAQAIVVNSGYANACTGKQGIADAEEMARAVADKLGIAPQNVLVASTGVIGTSLPMDRVRAGIDKVTLTKEGGHELAEAIMTTDTFTKEVALHVEAELGTFILGGVAKGAGMIHPNLATMLCFLTTDATVDATFLQSALHTAADSSFNMVTVDGDTSPSDTVVLLANGLAGTKTINAGNGEVFQKALEEVCLRLAECIATDGEGATKLIKVIVEGAVTEAEARKAARTIASSPLVKSAMHGNDPNWGRVLAALGRSGAKVDEGKLTLYLNSFCVTNKGQPVPFNKQEVSNSLDSKEISLKLELNLGRGKATAWGCDLSEEYVTINSAYTS